MKYLLLFLFSFQAFSSELDSFTTRNMDHPDLKDVLNVEVRWRMAQAVSATNDSLGCNEQVLKKKMLSHLGGFLIGEVESWLLQSGYLKKSVPFKDSIYKYGSISDARGLHVVGDGIGKIFKLNGEIVGTDKLGHFFSEGWDLYKIYKKTNNINDCFNFSDDLENRYFGYWFTGINSFADKVANYNGLIFWSDLLGDGYTSGKRPYIKCIDNKFEIVRQFNWADYVDGAWDEGINCNSYVSSNFTDSVFRRMRELGLVCPIIPEKCEQALVKYGDHAERLLHPLCLNINKL